MAVLESYYELTNILSSLYEEVDGCSFYEYLFPDNEQQGDMRNDYSHPNAIYLYQVDSGQVSYKNRKMRRRIIRGTGLSKPTVYKYYDQARQAVQFDTNIEG